MTELVKSIDYDQSEIIRNILKLHVPEGKIDCDPTFITGAFDARHLPLADSCISCMMLDPPFLVAKGKSLTSNNGNIISRRFGVYPDEKSLHRCYADMLTEAYRVLKPDGILIFKCQDKVSSGNQYMSHVFIMNEAVRTGFYPKDLFVLLAKNRVVADWQKNNQKHSRKYHSYFLVFQKTDRLIEYV